MHTDNTDDAASSTRAGWSLRRGLLVFAAVVAVEVLVVLGVAAWALAGARNDLVQAREQASSGRSLVTELDLPAAEAAFSESRTRFRDAQEKLGNPAVGVLRFVPVAGTNVRSVQALAAAGETVADTAHGVVKVVNEQPEGLGSYLPADGRFPVDRLAALADTAETADRRLADAVATVDASPSEGLVAPVADARAQFDGEVREARELVGSAAQASRALAAFLGVDGPRRYLFGAQNPAELRGTGGYIGAYAEATFDRGRFELSRFRPIQSLTSLPISEIPPPNADYAARYNRYGGAGFWPAINATPDFPSAAQAMVSLYERTEDVELDGVMVVDPFVLEALLRLVGDVRIPGLGRIGPDDVVSAVSVEARGQFASGEVRKETLGAIAAKALRRLLDDGGSLEPTQTLDLFAPIVQDRHLLLYSTDPAVQATLRDLRFAGALPPPEGDTVAVVVNNAAVNKVDFHTERSVDYRVQLLPDGSATAQLRVTFDNEASPDDSNAAFGTAVDGLDPGDNLSLVSVFCGRCEPTDAQPALRAKGPRKGMVIEQELGHTVATTLVTVPSATERVVGLSWQLDDAWSPDGDGCYELRYVSQPAIRASQVRVRVTPPRGYVRTGEDDAGAGELLHSGPLAGDLKMKSCYAA